MNEALFVIDPGFDIYESSTFAPGSFQVTNQSTIGQEIVSITLDLSTAIFPDLVYDPNGTGGDSVAKGFEVDLDPTSTPGTSGVASHQFLQPRDGGFDKLQINFSDFKPNQVLEFSLDTDPTSTKGADQEASKHFGSIAGLELVGATATVEFADGSVLEGQFYRIPDSDTGAQLNLVGGNTTIAAPTIEAVGLSGNATVNAAAQTIQVTGTAGSPVSLLIVDGALLVEGEGFDVDPFEANTAMAVQEFNATIGANGTVDIPVTLTRTTTENGTGGLNYIVARYQDAAGNLSNVSAPLVLELAAPVGVPTATLNPGTLTNNGYSFTITYQDNGLVAFNSIEAQDLVVTAPDGATALPVTLESVAPGANNQELTATYSVTAPETTWQASDRGLYTVAVKANEVSDTEGNSVAAANIGSFIVNANNDAAANGVIRIEAEDYKTGTLDVEYFDFEAENFGGAYRPNEAVDIEVTGDEGGGFNVAFIQAGEFLTYDVNVTEPGNYNLLLRVASPTPETKNIGVVIDGQTYNASFGDTGDFQAYTDVVVNNVSLTTGVKELRLDFNAKDFNINYIELAPAAPVSDNVAPVATLNTANITQQSSSPASATFTVTFTDNVAVTSGSLDDSDLTVTAPSGVQLPVTLVSVDVSDNGSPRTATYSIAAPNGTWQNSDQGNYAVAVKAGEITDTSNNAIAAASLGSFALNIAASPPPSGTIRVEAEDFKQGINSIDYFDTSKGNFGGAYRQTSVDIEATQDSNGGYNLAWIEAGEFLAYDINVAEAGTYDLKLRVATPATDTKTVEMAIAGATYTANFSNTGGWQNYQDIVVPGVNLNAGTQELKVNFQSGGFNFNYLDLVQPQVASGSIRIEAEDYKPGTNDVEFFDTEAENFGGAYRPSEPVDIEATSDEGGGFNVAFIAAGEFLTYDVTIPETRNYNLVLRVASPTPETKNIDVTIGGQTYNASFGSTGDFQAFTDVVINNVALNAGEQDLRLDFNSTDFNVNYIEIVPADPVVDGVAPRTTFENTPDDSDLVTINLLSNSDTNAEFAVTYSDNVEVDSGSIDASDIEVINAAGTLIPVSLVGTNGGLGQAITANYSIAAPGGTWNAADEGNYTVAIKQNSVNDTNGNGNVAETLGILSVNVINPVTDGTTRINVGAAADALDTAGNLWQADANFTGANAITPSFNPIDNTQDDFIFQSQREGNNFSYAIPLDDGNYNVSLYFSELNFTEIGDRLFNVSVEGEAALSNLDINQLTNNAFLDGFNDASIVEVPNLSIVRDGALNLEFTSVVNGAILAGIEITPVAGAQVLIEESEQSTSVTEGGNGDTYQILLNAQPTANVTINLQLDGQVSSSANSLVFTPANWNVPQTVTINAVDDAQGESFHSSTINHTITTTDPAYSSLTVPAVAVNIVDNDVAPIKFKPQIELDVIDDGFYGTTAGTWGPDGRLYVALATGLIQAYTLDDNYNIVETQSIDVLRGVSNPNITGIAFNPFENDGSQPKIYVAHNQFYANRDTYLSEGGAGFDELVDFSPYSGQVSVLEGPNFDTITPLVQNIGVSNHDHGVNGLAFDANGDLLITSGSNTNAGIVDDEIGGIDESPFTAGILKAEITKPDFNGNIQYKMPDGWVPPAGLNLTKPDGSPAQPEESQGFGGIVEVIPGADVSVYAPGFRNAYDLIYSTKGIIYATENDANTAFGDESLNATEQRPFTLDPLNELNIVEEGNYYGQPNRSRGRTEPRENTYIPSQTPSSAEYTAPIEEFVRPVQGLVEYRSNAFDGQLRGNLLTQVFNGPLWNIDLSADGQTTVNTNIFEIDVVDGISGETVEAPPFYTTFVDDSSGQTVYEEKGLDVLTGFGGALIGLNESDSRVTVVIPDDDAVTAMVAYDISEWRAPASGGGQFTIGGINFGTLANTTVEIGGKPATITSVSEKRIVGTFPAFAQGDAIIGSTEFTEDNLLDITVNSAGASSTITDAYQPLFI